MKKEGEKEERKKKEKEERKTSHLDQGEDLGVSLLTHFFLSKVSKVSRMREKEEVREREKKLEKKRKMRKKGKTFQAHFFHENAKEAKERRHENE